MYFADVLNSIVSFSTSRRDANCATAFFLSCSFLLVISSPLSQAEALVELKLRGSFGDVFGAMELADRLDVKGAVSPRSAAQLPSRPVVLVACTFFEVTQVLKE